jgi:ComF family protein
MAADTALGRVLGSAFGGPLGGLLGLLAPPVCWACSGLSRRGDPLCAGCRASLHRLAPEPVVLCGVPVWAPLAYSGPARDLVRALKFRGAIALADAMAAQIVANAPPALLDPAPPALLDLAPPALLDRAPAAARCTIVPVPLHPQRLRSRGYNQAAVIAEAVGRRAQLPVLDCLVRTGPSVTQVGRDRAERRAGPSGRIEFRASAEARAPAAATRVVLVDDVVTTGATLGACRDALVAHGAEEVAAVCFARTIGR